jgi:anti-anti-sigma factor
MNYLLTDNKDGMLTIFLTGDIDAQNAAEIKNEVDEILKSRGDSTLVFDAKKLCYISSAGLRMILATQKAVRSKISVINLSPEVIEIFKLAGFQHLMEIKGA